MAHVAAVLYGRNAEFLQVDALGYKSGDVVRFQRSSVVVTELALLLAIVWYRQYSNMLTWTRRFARTVPEWPKQFKLIMLVFAAPGLLIVDHIHFQYNGFLLSILVLSITLMFRVCSMTANLSKV